MSHTPADEPRLAAPGAGIPTIERLVGSVVLAFKRWRGTPRRTAAEFDRQRSAIARLCDGQEETLLARRVLIPRLRGLEDSSRYWSVYMTLDHLRIVNDHIAGVIVELTQGRVPRGRASTAAVKPRAGVGNEVVAAYDSACDRLVAIVASSSNLRTKVRFAHPWFGPLDASGWHEMAATHMGIHRAQIDRIISAGSSQA